MEYTGGQALRGRFLDKTARAPKIKLTKDNSFLVFPFNLVMGYITSTENGIRNNDNVNVFDYSTFQRIFTGLENVLAQWEGAYRVVKNEQINKLTKGFYQGRNFRAYIPTEEMGAQFEAAAISGDFLAEFTEETFTIHTYEDITEKDLFKLFIIPELKEDKWLYITSATKYYLPNKKLHHTEITLETLNNRIAKSGRAVEEYIQRSAPGEGYAWPSIQNDGSINIDDIRKRDVPITNIQIEGAGAMGFNTIFCYGRPTKYETRNGVIETAFNPFIEPPRILLPLRMETAIPSPVNTRPSAETDWVVSRWRPTLDEGFSDWKEEIQANFDLNQRAQYEGLLYSIGSTDDVNASNPVNEGTRNRLLWDIDWDFKLNKTYDTHTDSYTGNTMTINKRITIPEMLCHNLFGDSHLSTLPLSVTQNVSWSLKDIPIVGGIASKLRLGIPYGWTNIGIKVKMSDIVLALPASMVDYGNVLIKQSNNVRIDLNSFTDEVAKNDAIEFSGIKATGSIWKVELTDRFTKTINGVEHTFNTNDLGQKHPDTDDNGNDIKGGVPTTLLWDETCKPTNRKASTPGFVIDTSTFRALGKMEYRITYSSNNTQAWSGTYQTSSKFTGSIRDWTNAIKHSNWSSESGEIDYPAEIVAPNPPNTNDPIINLEVSNNNGFEKFEEEYTTNKRISASFVGSQAPQQINNYVFTPGQPGSDEMIFSLEQIYNITQNYIYKLAEFDTTPYGGINTFAGNYEQIEINIDTLLRQLDTAGYRWDTYNTTGELLDFKIDTKTLLAQNMIIYSYDHLPNGYNTENFYGQYADSNRNEGTIKYSTQGDIRTRIDNNKIIIEVKVTAINAYSTDFPFTIRNGINAPSDNVAYIGHREGIGYPWHRNIKIKAYPKKI